VLRCFYTHYFDLQKRYHFGRMNLDEQYLVITHLKTYAKPERLLKRE